MLNNVPIWFIQTMHQNSFWINLLEKPFVIASHKKREVPLQKKMPNPLQSVLSKMHWAKNKINSSRFASDSYSLHLLCSSLFFRSILKICIINIHKKRCSDWAKWMQPFLCCCFLAGTRKKNLHENNVIGIRPIKLTVSFLWHDWNNCRFAQPH